jgi:ABC-type nitrate/sulfonate/bicarbonate transport system permease component
MANYSRALEPRLDFAQQLEKFWDAHRTAITRTVAVVAFLALWEYAVRGGGVNPLFLSSPFLVFERLYEVFADGSIWPHIAASGHVAGVGFLIAVAIGVPLGIAMGRSRVVRDTLEPFIMAKYSAPTVAFLPLLILWFGIGAWSKIILVVLGAVFVIIINTEAGVSNVDRKLVETARAFCAKETDILIKIIAPAALPFIIAGLRLSIGRVLITVVVAEMFASTAGLGYLIFQAGAAYDTTQMFVGVVLLAGAGVVLNSALRSIETRIAPWMHAQLD